MRVLSMSMALLGAFLLGLDTAAASSVIAGGSGYAAYFTEARGLYMPFNMPATAITMETWTKANPVRHISG